MDHREFFHQATLRICGNLEIEVALQDLLLFLLPTIPVAEIILQYFDREYNCLRSIAYAKKDERGKLDLLMPLSKEAGDLASEGPPDSDVFLFEHPAEFPVTKEVGEFHQELPTSSIILALRSDQEMLGYLTLVSENGKKFKPDNLELVKMIKEPAVIAMANALKHREIKLLNDLLSDDNRYLQSQLRRLHGENIIGSDFGLKDVVQKAQKVAPMESPVLLLGETGVGKDVIANTIHQYSARNKGPFISVNCGAIPDTLIDSELFGHEKGAFTGALEQKRGRFERANRGTLFLDEVGELPLAAQVRLLRVLQNKEIERVGGTKTIPLDIRIIAATNRNLEEMVSEKTFREDLLFRLNVFPIEIPPLRERRPDIPALLQYFIKLKAKELKLSRVPELAEGEISDLMGYSWPGNVREIQNLVERALILNTPPEPLSLGLFNSSKHGGKEENTSDKHAISRKLDDVMSNHISDVLLTTEGRISGPGGAAEVLGINPNTLRARIKKLNIDVSSIK